MNDAQISPCGRYRYTLDRRWAPDHLPTLHFVMCNPSTADATEDDPTIRKCMTFAKTHGFAGIRVMNLFALRATNPKELMDPAIDPVGPDNDHWLRQIQGQAVLAWGGIGGKVRGHLGRVSEVISVISPSVVLLHLGQNKDGSPKHPLYLPNSTRLERW